MKKISIIFSLSLCFSVLFAQNNATSSIKLADGFMHINNNEGAYYTVSVPGDSIKQTEIDGIFIVDKQIVQLTSMPVPTDKLNWRFDIEKEVKLLQSLKDDEINYLKENVFKAKDLKVETSLYINNKGKTFLFWSYDIPKSAQKPNAIDPSEQPIVSNLFISCIANSKVVGVNLPITANASRKKKEAFLAKIADDVVVYGDKIDVGALSYRIFCRENKEKFVYMDSVNHFKVKVPDWLNITQSTQAGTWGGTMYDHSNLMNGILIVPISKNKFRNEAEVERYFITGNEKGKPAANNKNILWKGHQLVDKPYNCNGNAYELKYTFDNMDYKCRYLVYETKNAYLLAMYTATDTLYDKDLANFKDFLEYLFPSL